jgi:hypothetical protein
MLALQIDWAWSRRDEGMAMAAEDWGAGLGSIAGWGGGLGPATGLGATAGLGLLAYSK